MDSTENKADQRGSCCIADPSEKSKCEFQPVTVKRHENPKTVSKRVARHRARQLSEIWAARGIKSCGGKAACWWAPEGTECACEPGRPCVCERELYENLVNEGRSYFAGEALSGLAASTMLETARAGLLRDPEAPKLRLELLRILLGDRRKVEDLRQRERRLLLEESRAKPRQPSLAAYLGSKTDNASKPASVASGAKPASLLASVEAEPEQTQ